MRGTCQAGGGALRGLGSSPAGLLIQPEVLTEAEGAGAGGTRPWGASIWGGALLGHTLRSRAYKRPGPSFPLGSPPLLRAQRRWFLPRIGARGLVLAAGRLFTTCPEVDGGVVIGRYFTVKLALLLGTCSCVMIRCYFKYIMFWGTRKEKAFILLQIHQPFFPAGSGSQSLRPCGEGWHNL